MSGSNKLTKKDYITTSLRAFFLQNGFNYSNYQGTGYASVIYPAIKKIYADEPEKLKQTMVDSCDFYNTNPHFLPFITSLHLVMLDNGMSEEESRGIKMALMGPLAGIGDSLSQFCLAPLFSTIAASLAAEGLIAGPIIFIVAMNFILTTIKITTGLYGYKLGVSVVDKLSKQMSTISKIANTIGVTVIAGLAATFVKMNVPIKFAAGELNADVNQSIVTIQGMLDKIAPSLLPMLYTLLVYYLIKKKGWTTYKLVILTVIIGIAGYGLGILS
ncbi:PTS system mannose/fructose/sorbose family transporter subunit IID [Anaerorhabdus sp.]|uniref:PTS system mannose/fructose/sorbose family transporter subunit IID n=1 Tax=Anaerorhabdus sp. TaxID=1872524 RepID=UPI002FCC1787